MPSLPSPLRSKKYRLFYITGEGLLLESKAVAPLTAEDEAEIDNLNLGHVRSAGGDGNMARITKRHCIYIRRAQEFFLINTELAEWYGETQDLIDFIVIALAGIITFFLIVGVGSHKNLAILTVANGILKSWSIFAKYAILESGHRHAAKGFAEIVYQIKGLVQTTAELKDPNKVMDVVYGGIERSYFEQKERVTLRHLFRSVQDAVLKTTEIFVHWAAGVLSKLFYEARKAASGKAPPEIQLRILSAETPEVDGYTDSEIEHRLRVFYRKCAEYQVCHTRFEDRYHKLRFKLGFGHLLLSTVTSTLLFLHLLPNFASMLSSLIMLLTIVMNALNLAVMEGDHKRYRKKFSKLKMKIATVLLMEPEFALRDRFPDQAKVFLRCEINRPVTLGASKFTDGDTGLPILHLVTRAALRMEHAEKAKSGAGEHLNAPVY